MPGLRRRVRRRGGGQRQPLGLRSGAPFFAGGTLLLPGRSPPRPRCGRARAVPAACARRLQLPLRLRRLPPHVRLPGYDLRLFLRNGDAVSVCHAVVVGHGIVVGVGAVSVDLAVNICRRHAIRLGVTLPCLRRRVRCRGGWRRRQQWLRPGAALFAAGALHVLGLWSPRPCRGRARARHAVWRLQQPLWLRRLPPHV